MAKEPVTKKELICEIFIRGQQLSKNLKRIFAEFNIEHFEYKCGYDLTDDIEATMKEYVRGTLAVANNRLDESLGGAWRIRKLDYDSMYVWNERIKPLCPYRYLPNIRTFCADHRKILAEPQMEIFKCKYLDKDPYNSYGDPFYDDESSGTPIQLPAEMIFINTNGEVFEVIDFDKMNNEAKLLYNKIIQKSSSVREQAFDGHFGLHFYFFIGIDFDISSLFYSSDLEIEIFQNRITSTSSKKWKTKIHDSLSDQSQRRVLLGKSPHDIR